MLAPIKQKWKRPKNVSIVKGVLVNGLHIWVNPHCNRNCIYWLNPKPLLAASTICHMKTRRGKTWEISSQTVMSGRYRVDTQGCCSGADPLIEMVASLDKSMQSLWFITIGHHPMCVYPLSTQQHHTWLNLPHFPLHICILQELMTKTVGDLGLNPFPTTVGSHLSEHGGTKGYSNSWDVQITEVWISDFFVYLQCIDQSNILRISLNWHQELT